MNDFITQAENDQKDQNKAHLLLFTKLKGSRIMVWTKIGSEFSKELAKGVSTIIRYKDYIGVDMNELLKIKL